MVYAVAVSQPVQSWTVLRSHDEFSTMSDVLTQTLPGIPSCHPLTDVPGSADLILSIRNELQKWLSAVLVNSSARESTAVRNFLTLGANTILPKYEDVVWTQFNTAIPSPPPEAASPRVVVSTRPVVVDDMEMDDMFLADEDGAAPEEDQDEFDDDIPSASVRYKPFDGAVTSDDLLDMAGDVEMVEDVGSLAQSLGASHLGRSLQLQAEMKFRTQGAHPVTNPVKGLNIGGAAAEHSAAAGGIGGAITMAAAAQRGAEPFNMRPLESAPRLDSFKMIRVIGKGSFGACCRLASCVAPAYEVVFRPQIESHLTLYVPGKVFLVREVKTNHTYALKVLRKDNIIKRNQVEHTKTERSVLGYVRHPFIVGMNMAFQSKDKLYFVLDYCAGGELFFHLGKEGRFHEDRAKFYAAEIILAISYVHSLGIIYRDLKPENVLLDAEGHIRLTDFGLSKEGISGSSSGAYSFCGTPEYLGTNSSSNSCC
jgi:Protein kinase domain